MFPGVSWSNQTCRTFLWSDILPCYSTKGCENLFWFYFNPSKLPNLEERVVHFFQYCTFKLLNSLHSIFLNNMFYFPAFATNNFRHHLNSSWWFTVRDINSSWWSTVYTIWSPEWDVQISWILCNHFWIYHCGYMHRCTMIASTRMGFKISHKFIQQKIPDSSSLCLRKENRKISEASRLCWFFVKFTHARVIWRKFSRENGSLQIAHRQFLTGHFLIKGWCGRSSPKDVGVMLPPLGRRS